MESSFQSVGPVEEFPPGSRRLIQLGAKPVLVLHRKEGFIAFEDYCPHRAGPLSEGKFVEGKVVCPWHGAQFSLADGRALCGPTRHSLRFHPTRVRDGNLEIAS